MNEEARIQQPEPRIKIAAVIPHWNRRELLDELLQTLGKQTRPFDEIIVADNGSTDDSAQLAEAAGARVLRLGRNLGFAAAVNRGIQAASADWIAILNNDVTLDPNWLAALIEGVQQQNAAFASGKILRRSDPKILDGAFDEVTRAACACRCGAGKPDSALWNKPRRIRFAPMTAALFRRDLFSQAGPLDESFGSYLEDVDFGIRCALLGREGVYVPDAVAYHRGSATLGAWNSDTVRLISRNQILLTLKYFRAQPRWPLVAGQLLWGVLAIRHGKGLAYLRGKLSGLRLARSAGNDYEENKALRSILEASERNILELERQTGFDWYWRSYFWLLRR